MNGTLVLLIGPSGVGKDTIQAKLKRTYQFVTPRGCWTRPYRSYETKETADSDSISVREFLTLKMQEKLTADNIVHGEFYGTPKANFTDPLDRGEDVLRIVTADGAAKVKEDLPGYRIITIFLVAPLETLRKRLTARGDTPEQIERRLQTAAYELSLDRAQFDAVVDANRPIGQVYNDVVAVLSMVGLLSDAILSCLDVWPECIHPEVADVVDEADEHHEGWYQLCPCSACQSKKTVKTLSDARAISLSPNALAALEASW